MTAYRHARLVHHITDMDKQHKAGRSSCGLYLDLVKKNFDEDNHINCVPCLGTHLCNCAHFRAMFGGPHAACDSYHGHEPLCDAVEGLDGIDERIEDITKLCIDAGTHNQARDSDGFCQACGYQYDPDLFHHLVKQP